MNQELAVNGSRNRHSWNTILLLTSFVEGRESTGASVDLSFTVGLEIEPSIRDLHCWDVPGKCIHHDEMTGWSLVSEGSVTRSLSDAVGARLIGEEEYREGSRVRYRESRRK